MNSDDPREAIVRAISTLKRCQTVMIAHYSDKPYPDDPRWTPWTRWGQPTASRAEAAIADLNAVLRYLSEQPAAAADPAATGGDTDG